MAGRYDIELDLLNRAVRQLEDMSPAWPEVEDVLRREVDRNFEEQGTPVYGKWQPSKRALAAQSSLASPLKRDDRGKFLARNAGSPLTLVMTGHMRSRVGALVERWPDALFFGTDVPYAKELTTGMPWMPDRPHMQIGPDTVERIAKMLLRHVFSVQR